METEAAEDDCFHATRDHLDRDVLGRTIHQAIHRMRIDRARTLLAETDLPIKSVAQHAGFKTMQYLTRNFRRLTGDTPAAFRRRRAGRLPERCPCAAEL